MTSVTFANVWKQFRTHTAIEDLNLEIRDGEFMVFVGPSGCGKTITMGSNSINYGVIAAYSIVYSFPVIILFLGMSRQFKAGFSLSGAIK